MSVFLFLQFEFVIGRWDSGQFLKGTEKAAVIVEANFFCYFRYRIYCQQLFCQFDLFICNVSFQRKISWFFEGMAKVIGAEMHCFWQFFQRKLTFNIEELAYGRKRLLDAIEEIDYVVTHETPLSARSYIKRQKQIENDYALPETFEEWYRFCLQEARFKKWYFGHMHTDQEISSGLQAVFNKIYMIGDAWTEWVMFLQQYFQVLL